MIQIAQGWEMSVDRGPDWLFVRPRSVNNDMASMPPLAEEIWALLEQNQIRRVVVELDQIPLLHSYLIGQLVWLHKRIASQGGLMRVCGLSTANRDVLRMCRLSDRFPAYLNRGDAVMGYQPTDLPR
jgi:anti-anti-sigma factor